MEVQGFVTATGQACMVAMNDNPAEVAKKLFKLKPAEFTTFKNDGVPWLRLIIQKTPAFKVTKRHHKKVMLAVREGIHPLAFLALQRASSLRKRNGVLQ